MIINIENYLVVLRDGSVVQTVIQLCNVSLMSPLGILQEMTMIHGGALLFPALDFLVHCSLLPLHPFHAILPLGRCSTAHCSL